MSISSSSNELVLTPINKSKLNEVADNVDGFTVDITDVIGRGLEINKSFPHNKNYEFVVNLKRGIKNTPERKVLVHTNVLCDSKKIGWFFKTLFETDNGIHTIEIFP